VYDMGLLERALIYKQRINETGKETLIDRIKGPAETDSTRSMIVDKIDVSEIDQLEDTVDHYFDESQDEKESIKNVEKNLAENKNLEEEIILFDDSNFPTVGLEQNIEIQHDEVHPSREKLEKIPNNENDINDSEVENSTVIQDFEMPKFNDYGTLFEIQKEFIKADTIEDVYSTILFSIMGQLGVSSVSIITPSIEDVKKWIITDSHGIKISDNDLNWNIDEGILQILNTYKGVLDIEEIKNDSNLRDDYYKFIAVDARIITPLTKDGCLAGAILVGEKINSEEFTAVELEFLQALSDIGSSIIESLSKYEKINTELLGLRIEKEILSDVEFFQDSLLNVSSVADLGEIIRKNFYSLGLECYSLFMEDQIGGDYYPVYFDPEDLLGFNNSGFKIKRDNRLISFLVNKKSSIILENFNESSVMIDTFGRNRIVKMESFIAYSFIISGELSGFITIFKINPAVNIIDIDIRIQKINRFLFPYLHRVYELDPNLNKYIDLSAKFYERIESEIKHAKELNIPLSLVLFTIKNYKRFHDRFGAIEFDKLFNFSAEIFKSKLSIGDFSGRIDRNKFLLVLPGKEKRYSVMLANTIKNEILEKFNMSDFKLLITSSNSVFPEEGMDLFSILEVLY